MTIDQLVDGYAALSTLVRPTSTPRIAPDADDDVVIGTALAARADLIVTGDRGLREPLDQALLRLGEHLDSAFSSDEVDIA